MYQLEKYPVKIKQIVDVICEARLEDIPHVVEEEQPDVVMSLGPCQPAGAVYYSNNQITCTAPTTFMAICYFMPMIVEDGEDGYIPDHLVMLTVCKALSILSEESGDVEQCARYEAVFTQLVNSYNENFLDTLPNTLSQGYKINAHQL